MRVVVVGKRGMLAQELPPCLRRLGFEVWGRGRPELDITEAASIRQTITELDPDILINAAAYTAVDKAEAEPATAFAVNRDGTAHLAQVCRDADIPLIHISTDYVFDGRARHPYCEDDAVDPLGIYGRSKWEGEEAIRCCHQRHLIVRTAWLYGRHGANFVHTMLRLARERDILRVVDDQQGCPTWSRDLAEALAVMCQRIRQGQNTIPWGTYHFSSAGQTTWYGFAGTIVSAAKAFEPLAVQRVVPIPTTAYPTPARRPAYSVLDCNKIQSAFDVIRRPWRQSLHDYIQELYACTPTPPATF